ncbi:MAG: Asp-tRNA(Asn)/Glu-tRNA(Gln) amidotransferase subunit GatC [Bacteroidetes bacterium]|nr:Asp-tRNA(Asn)/Glu-tRNA(Gln) amidotransferase subunit GatC [Bacteroidota bacterium]
MDKIDLKTVEEVAHLARLEFADEAAKQAIAKDMNNMLAFVAQLNKVDTTGVEPLIYMTEEANTLRTDEIIQDITQKEALQNAAKKDSDYFKAPKVIEKNG